MQTSSKRSMLLIIALLLLIPIGILQFKIDPLRHQYEPGRTDTGVTGNLPIEMALGAAVGFREAVAGLLWVRTDEFFHDGDYESISPMVRIITWLDPHQIDVYQTGAWHMDYNFTDEEQRSDRRYVPLSLALLREGIRNNPKTISLYSDISFVHYYRKIEDYPNALKYFRDGQNVIDQLIADAKANPKDTYVQNLAKDARNEVTKTSHGLAHALEATGQLDEAEKQWNYCVKMHEDNIKNNIGTSFGEDASLATAKNKLKELQMRRKYRVGLDKDQEDVKFDATLTRVAPKVFVAEGQLNIIGATKFILETGERQWGPVDGCRVEFRIQDEGYKMPDVNEFSLKSLNLNPDVTILQDAFSVRKGKFSKKIDMSKDTNIYTFKGDKYTVTFWFNPGNINDAPPNVQDKLGWLGEGMTDKHYLDTSGVVPGDITSVIPGLRMIKKTITLTKEDLLGTGRKVFN